MNTAMKMSALLILVLLGSLERVSSAEGANTGVGCCTKYETKKIPLAMVVSWYKTSSSCAKAAYVFVTKRGRHICVDPTHGWVRSYAPRVNSRSATTVAPGTSEMNTPERVPSHKDSGVGADCCTRYEKKEIPLSMVVSWHETSSSCPKAAVVFVTKRGKRICVNPSEDWVLSHMTQVDSRSRKATTVSIKTFSERVSSGKASGVGVDCCTKYETRRIPLAMVVSWHKTSSSCAKAAYVFVTKRGKRICVDPTHAWVRSYAPRVPGTSKKNTNA